MVAPAIFLCVDAIRVPSAANRNNRPRQCYISRRGTVRRTFPARAKHFSDFDAADWRNGNHRHQPLSPRARVCPTKLVSAVVHLRAPAVPLEPCTSRRTASSATVCMCARGGSGITAHLWRTSAWLRGVQVLQMKGQWVSGTGRTWPGREKASRRESH